MADREALSRAISEAVSRAINESLNQSFGQTQNTAQPQTPSTLQPAPNHVPQIMVHDDSNSNNAEPVEEPLSDENRQRKPGRESIVLPKERLGSMLKLKLPISRIAKVLNVSRPVVYKAMAKYGLSASTFTDLEQDQLQQIVSEIKLNHPNAGEVMIQGHLRAKGIHIQRHRVRDAIHAADPTASARKKPPIKRRVYYVPCPNYLWHIDGNHKLIRWRLVIHHGIDGFSRLVTFCQCSGNNRSTTVLPIFEEAVSKYGRPIHIRTDYGGENILIWRKMNEFWGDEAQAVIVGSSVHNQRIERHNRAVNEQVVAMYKDEFYELEREGVLDPLNHTDLFCLHYVYLPYIQKSLCEFVAAHNNHQVSTEEQQTPLQLFWTNVHLASLHSGDNPSDVLVGGIDVSNLDQSEIPHVQVPDIENPLSDVAFTRLQTTIHPFNGPDRKTIYRQVVEFVGRSLCNC